MSPLRAPPHTSTHKQQHSHCAFVHSSGVATLRWLAGGSSENDGNRITHQTKLYFLALFARCETKVLDRKKKKQRLDLLRFLTLRRLCCRCRDSEGRNEGQFSLDLVLTRNVHTCQKKAALVMAGWSARDAGCTSIPSRNVPE